MNKTISKMEERNMMTDKKIIKYAKCAVNFYGLVSAADIAIIIEHYDKEIIPVSRIQEVLSTFITKRTILKEKQQLYYKSSYIPEDAVLNLYDEIKDQPFYFYDTKTDFFYHESANFVDLIYPYGRNLMDYLEKFFSDKEYAYLLAEEMTTDIAQCFSLNHEIKDVLQNIIQPALGAKINTKEEFEILVQHLIQLHNHTRKIDKHGFTPSELYARYNKQQLS